MRDYAAESRQLRELLRDLLASGAADAAIAWVRGDPLRTRVALVERGREELLDRVVWSPFCAPSTATFLKRSRRGLEGRRVAIALKDCDLAALNVMIQENLIKRESVVTIGLRCDGLADPELFPVPEGAVEPVSSDAEGVVAGGRRVGWSEFGYATCDTCSYKHMQPDHAIGEYAREKRGGWAHVSALRALPRSERRERFSDMFERCIRCYACREVCPVCSCLECAIDPGERMVTPRTTPLEKTTAPQWACRERAVSENAVYLMTRAMHMAGRCVRCGWCERSCPVGIPLMEILDMVNHAVATIYKYEPGRDPSSPPFLASYAESDPSDEGGDPL